MTARTTTARTHELLTQAHDLAGDASHTIADTATHVLDALGSTIEHTIDQARSLAPVRHRRRPWLPLVLVLAGGTLFIIVRRRRRAPSAGSPIDIGTAPTTPHRSTDAARDAA